MMTESLRRLAGLTSEASNLRVFQRRSMGPVGAFVSRIGSPSAYRPWTRPGSGESGVVEVVVTGQLPLTSPKGMARGGRANPTLVTSAMIVPSVLARRRAVALPAQPRVWVALQTPW